MKRPIKVIDLFAGPGGLGEGFSSFKDSNGENRFKIALSIEKETEAHKTLTLRSFFRQFEDGKVPNEYYETIKGELGFEELYKAFPKQAFRAKSESWQAELGKTPNEIIDIRIKEALGSEKKWILIGGPPCQAYSLVGRSRRQQVQLNPISDVRVYLYKEYLRILSIHKPPIFLMENVKGILSAEVERNPLFQRILDDLSEPELALKNKTVEFGQKSPSGYTIYSLVKKPNSWSMSGTPIYRHGDFVIKAEDYGIPQTRHRVILLGIRNDISKYPDTLRTEDKVSIKQVIGDLPRLRSGLSKEEDSWENWINVLKSIPLNGTLGKNSELVTKIESVLSKPIKPQKGRGSVYISGSYKSKYLSSWYFDPQLNGVFNHETRGHMNSDIHRYLFSSCFAEVFNRSPKLSEFPKKLLPEHLNISRAVDENHFGDRFRVQIANEPSKTVTSHISKDGHYYIHYDPFQCRSLTVREAARIQTFPDNYFFCGNKTAQYTQVGNAVPPLLAFKIASIINSILI